MEQTPKRKLRACRTVHSGGKPMKMTGTFPAVKEKLRELSGANAREDVSPSYAEQEEGRLCFLNALETMTPAEIGDGNGDGNKTRIADTQDIIRWVMIALCAAVLFFSLIFLGKQAITYLKSGSTYSEASSEFWNDGGIAAAVKGSLSATSPDFATCQSSGVDLSKYQNQQGSSYSEEFSKILAKLNALKLQNSDIYGYIYIPGTEVDYPVVRHSDNSYYLKHDYLGKYSGSGAIFAHCANLAKIIYNKNTVLFGHHMSSGSTMFHTLDNFFDEDFFNTHPDIYVYTTDGILHYTVFAVYITKDTYKYINTNFSGDAEWIDFCNEMQSNSVYVREGITFDASSKLLTLSTCTNIVKTDRITVQAVLTEITT